MFLLTQEQMWPYGSKSLKVWGVYTGPVLDSAKPPRKPKYSLFARISSIWSHSRGIGHHLIPCSKSYWGSELQWWWAVTTYPTKFGKWKSCYKLIYHQISSEVQGHWEMWQGYHFTWEITLNHLFNLNDQSHFISVRSLIMCVMKWANKVSLKNARAPMNGFRTQL